MGVRIDGANSNVKGKAAMLGLSPAAVVFASDANYTVLQAEYECPVMVVTSGVALTATRNLVLPLRAGIIAFVYNNTTGGQSVQVIGSSGTGYAVPTGKKAIVYCDGTNWMKWIVEA